MDGRDIHVCRDAFSLAAQGIALTAKQNQSHHRIKCVIEKNEWVGGRRKYVNYWAIHSRLRLLRGDSMQEFNYQEMGRMR